MSSKTENVIDFRELAQLSIPCPRCTTKVLLDCNDQEARIPSECPACGEEYGEPFRASLQRFREVYRKLSEPGARTVQVRVAAE